MLTKLTSHNIYDAEAHFSKLAGKPVVKMVPIKGRGHGKEEVWAESSRGYLLLRTLMSQ
jgi:hypothetical protein